MDKKCKNCCYKTINVDNPICTNEKVNQICNSPKDKYVSCLLARTLMIDCKFKEGIRNEQ